jgi:chromodomain-helicase-DNA-binding protein 4
MGVEHCKLCGVAHLGVSDKCLHYLNVIQIRIMLDSLRQSSEPQAQVEAVRVVLRRELAKKLQAKQRKPRTSLPS